MPRAAKRRHLPQWQWPAGVGGTGENHGDEQRTVLPNAGPFGQVKPKGQLAKLIGPINYKLEKWHCPICALCAVPFALPTETLRPGGKTSKGILSANSFREIEAIFALGNEFVVFSNFAEFWISSKNAPTDSRHQSGRARTVASVESGQQRRQQTADHFGFGAIGPIKNIKILFLQKYYYTKFGKI